MSAATWPLVIILGSRSMEFANAISSGRSGYNVGSPPVSITPDIPFPRMPRINSMALDFSIRSRPGGFEHIMQFWLHNLVTWMYPILAIIAPREL